MNLKSIRVLSGTGTAGVKQVKILPNVTGPTGTFQQANQLTGFTGPTGTFPNVQNANTYVAGMKEIIINGYVSPTGALPAVLSSPALTDIDSTSMTPGVTTDTGSGTLYAVVSTNSSTPSAAQIKAGQDSTGSAAAYASSKTPSAGANTFTATGLTASTAYYAFFIQNSTGGDSNIATVGPVSTAAAHSAQAIAFLARTSGLDATHTNAYYALIDGLVSDNVWSKLDMLHVYATQDSTTALLNLVSSSFGGTTHGSPTFTADRGFTGVDGSSTVYIDTGFNPTTATTPHYVQNSAHLSAWSLRSAAAGSSNSGVIIGLTQGGGTTSDVFPRYNDGNSYYRLNGGSPGGVANSDGTGHYLVNRPSGSTVQGYKNGSSVQTSSDNSGSPLPNANVFVGVVDSGGTPATGFGGQIPMASIGGSLSSTDVTNFYNRLRTYMTTVGVP